MPHFARVSEVRHIQFFIFTIKSAKYCVNWGKRRGNGVCWKRIQVKIRKPLALVSEEEYYGVTLTLVSCILIEHLTAGPSRQLIAD